VVAQDLRAALKRLKLFHDCIDSADDVDVDMVMISSPARDELYSDLASFFHKLKTQPQP
jgi:hypothetical protein